MLLNFIKVDFRTNILVEKYSELISKGVKPSEILVLVQNSTLKKQFADKVLEKIDVDALEKLNIHSFFSIVYNTLIDNWCFIENSIPSDKKFILPNLVGLEVSQFLLKKILKDVDVKGYNSKHSLLHQIFRRYSLIVQNHLTDSEVRERSKILHEAFADDAEIIIKKLLALTLKTRSLDYLRQTLIFNHVYKNTDYFKNIKYLLVDDADEMTPVCFDFISYLKPQLKDWVICFDSMGSSRCGYLSADTSIEYKLQKLFNEGVNEGIGVNEGENINLDAVSRQAQNHSPLVGTDLRTDGGKCSSPDSEQTEPSGLLKPEGEALEAWSKSNTESKSLISERGEKTAILQARHFYSKEALNYSKELRQNQTPAEQILWYYLRKKQLAGLKFRRQEAFGNYILDFVCYEKRLVIELDGGGHLDNEQKKHDRLRDKFIEDNGYKVLRIFNNDIFSNIEGVIEKILQCADLTPPPSPLPQGAGECVQAESNLHQACDYSPLVGESKSLISERGLYKTEGVAQNAEEEELFLCEPSKPKDLTPPPTPSHKGRGNYCLAIDEHLKFKDLTPPPGPLPQGAGECVQAESNLHQACDYSPLVGESKSLISERGLYKTEGVAQNAEEEELFLCEPSKPKDLTPPPTPSHKGRGNYCLAVDEHLKFKDLTPPLPQGAGECTDMSQSLSHSVTQSLPSQNSFSQGDIIFSNILEDKHDKLENFTLTSLSKRAEILDYTIEKIQNLFKQNALPKDIAIITPLQDDMLRFTLNENLKCNVLFLSGSEKLVDNPLVKASLNILKLMLGIEISEMDLRVIISDYTGIPLKYAYNILHAYNKEKKLPEIDLEFYNDNYQRFYKAFCEIKDKDIKLSQKVYEMFYRVVAFADEKKINKFNFFIKQLRDFESVFGWHEVINQSAEIINQIENSIIAENPSSTLEINDNDLIVATPQKIIDNKISTKYQFWLDVSHSDWVKTDTGPLYNAWVMQADWSKDEYTVEDDIFLSKQKTARILRKLLLLAKNHVWACSSLFDPSGVENLGGIESYLSGGNDEPVDRKKAFKIVPRDDQKPVLDYKNGSMAISAVPGAGKTTILLALIIKLIDKGVTPSNIFVLTYMDSAARNFRERIKNMCPNSTQLPNISTIHGLALRIIKENSNFERLNLSSDFDICDDTQRMRILKSIGGKYTKTEIEEFDRAISVLKLQEGNIDTPSTDKKIEKFKAFYREYQAQLREANLIDYDDILIMSVKLLENNPDILEYYQNICEYIVEDEAQDSSGVQQRLIGLLSGKHKNLIRCGDINQAITTTFSNADVEGFREFIKNADKTVEMNHSQRCTQDVMNLANKLVNYGSSILPKAFFKSYMHGVEGKNPVSENAVFSCVFENTFAERNFILKEIKNILTRNKDATIGILLRNNYQVGSWAEFINNSGLKSITRSESLGQKGVFNTIFSILKFIQTPFDNEVLVSTYETLSELGFYKPRLQLEIRASEIPFIQKNGDDTESQDLSQFLWDMQYWLNSSTLPLEELVIRIGLFYYTSDIEKSNVYLIATLVKRLNSQRDFNLTLQRLEELSKRPSLSGFKFFSEEEDKDAMKGKVQIMTLHKSKGDEFEYVFLPEMAEKNLSIDTAKAKLKSSSIFMEEVKSFNPNYKHKDELELKEFNSEESLRLLYVAITRAQKKLYITTSAKAKGWGNKETEQEASVVFDVINSES